ncbi:MAG: YCF48-related protein [Flavipsychrobacter sp.]|nr:YCF48-related protein [Flavipsychrobacter sp.]
MHRNSILLILFLFAACKKDLLHYKSVQQLDAHTTTDRFDRILFVNNNVGFIVGGQRFANASILKTTDGGYTWNYTTYPNAGKEIFGIVASPNGTLYCIGFDGKLLYSADTGNTWQFKQMMYLPYTDMAVIDSNHIFLTGGSSFNSGFTSIMDTRNLTQTYDSLAYQLNRTKFSNSSTGFTCGYGAALKSIDAGHSWNFLQVGGDDFTGIDVHGSEMWVCGYNGGIYHSTDAGCSWEKLRNGNDLTLIRYNLQDIVFKDSQNGWAVGENGVVIHSIDGGHNWSQYDQFTSNGLKCVSICANGDLLVAGYNGALYRLNVQ